MMVHLMILPKIIVSLFEILKEKKKKEVDQSNFFQYILLLVKL